MAEPQTRTADKKPELYIGSDGKPRFRMVPVRKDIIKTESQKVDNTTTAAKRVAEGAYLKGTIESRADAHEDQANHHERQAEKAHKDGDRMAASVHKAAARAHMKAATYFDNYLSKPKHLRPEVASTGGSRAAHAATQRANQYNESVQVAENKDDDYHKTLGQTKNSDEGIAALKKKHGMSHTKAVATIKRLMGEEKGEWKTDTGWKKPETVKKDKFGNVIKNMSRHLAKAAAKKSAEMAKEEVELDEKKGDLHLYNNEVDARKKAKEVSGKVIKGTGKSTGKWAVKEEVELDELNKSTLANYIKKASDDRTQNAYDVGKSGKMNYKGLKRRQGINRAVNKLAKEEKIDEVLDRPGALASYRKKADDSGNRARNSATRKILTAPKNGERPDHSDELNTMRKRNKGQDMADRVAVRQFRKSIGQPYIKKEEVEVDEKKLTPKEVKRALASIKPPKKKPTLPKAPWEKKEEAYIPEGLTIGDGMGSWIKDFQASDAPQFAGKSNKERRDMAIAAYLSKKRGN